ANIDIDADVHTAHLTVQVHLRGGRGVGTAGESVGQRHDLGQPHSGIIAIGGRWRASSPIRTRIRPCRRMRGPTAAEAEEEKAVLPQLSKKQSLVGGAVTALRRRMRS